jgi:hypothetical protein
MSDIRPSDQSDPLAPPDLPTYQPMTARPPARKSSRAGSVALLAAAFVAVAGLAFAGGRLTAPAAAAAGFGGRFPFPSGAPGGGRQFPGGPGGFGALGGSLTVQGTVTAVSSDSITLQLSNGSLVTVPLDSQTTYHQATAGSASAVTVGSKAVIEPGSIDRTAGSSPAPDSSPGGFQFGPAVDVTVVAQ